MPFTYFISDIHLSESRSDITDCLIAFLQNDAPEAEALYVLGDLFEVWIGDDDVTPFNDKIAAAFRAVSQKLPVFFIHGNRDFAIRKGWADKAGMTLLPEQAVIDLYGIRTLLTHGDELCTRDIAYQRFRKKSRGWWWPRLMLALPLWYRRRVARNGREESKQNQMALKPEIMDVTPEEVVRVMEHYDAEQMIHGHTHRPNIHLLKVNGKNARRIVLGDWYDQGSILRVSPTDIQLESRKF
ncbi:UDP-2,3-diacylglucosamine diphosphatase [Alteromonas aestuariivivens]|uniref:UDP-2,3-diacylglucosamine hydrolase n=1 Tax=Alteromonas aestuariivivens TaxID=1938339 RepID=A0A3D8M3U3_9ALTE|nr:UDP-2,3-diacylglucosamine diphosphatase [Alteromonas aestuariivivens]RDV24301.1 UDP-2,3-diacylglucosamine diphosphatase [Alteromonas aestuariivivens]